VQEVEEEAPVGKRREEAQVQGAQEEAPLALR
jgi:hypothetical protein